MSMMLVWLLLVAESTVLLGEDRVLVSTRKSFTPHKVLFMVLVLDINSEHVAHPLRKMGLLQEKISDLCLLSI